MKVGFLTLGCRVNQYETEKIVSQFESKHYDIVDDNSVADIYIINTCSVTSMAERKSRQYIRKVKRENPEAIIVAVGCYVQKEDEEFFSMNEIDLFVGINKKNNVVENVENFLKDRRIKKDIIKRSQILEFEEMFGSTNNSRIRPYIKIQEGCDRFCSFCIIPHLRGGVRSRKKEHILKEVREYVKAGAKEIVLTGINTALYGEDIQGYGIVELIRDIDAIDYDFRIRIGSLEPTVVDINDINSLLQFKKLCHHFHLSIQNGSDAILKSMNRHYTALEYTSIVKALRKFDPYFSITTDIIVGFPGETNSDFEKTKSIVSNLDFLDIHVFQYSPREKTIAAKDFKNFVPDEVKKRRSEELIALGKQKTLDFYKGLIGINSRVLIEEFDENSVIYSGYSDNYVRVSISSPESLKVGEFIFCKLEDYNAHGMVGKLI